MKDLEKDRSWGMVGCVRDVDCGAGGVFWVFVGGLKRTRTNERTNERSKASLK